MILCNLLDAGAVSLMLHRCMTSANYTVLDRSSDDLSNGSLKESFQAILAPAKLVDEPSLLRRLSSYAPVIVVDEEPTIKKAVNAIRNGAYDYVAVGQEQELTHAILSSLNDFYVSSDWFNLEREILGDCDDMRELKGLIRTVAPTDGPVFLHGATGTGRNLVARSVHAASDRADRSFVKLDCDRVPPDRVMDELFGSGQGEAHTGRVLASDGGTLFLNEFGSLPANAQATLLHMLDHDEIQQFGEDQSIPVDIRLIVASVFTLDTLAELGIIGRGLCTRLSQFKLALPPLVDRGSDVMMLAEDKLKKHSANLGKTGMEFHESTVSKIMSYDWPGNVRELDQAIERAVLVCDSSLIFPEQLGIEVVPSADRAMELYSGEITSLEDYFIEFVRANEERYSETELAEKLGISRKSLWERRSRLGIPRRKAKAKRLLS